MSRFLHISPGVVIPFSELKFRFARSGGPGGQNVNKVETKVELLFDVASSRSLSEERKDRILAFAKSRIDAEGVLQIPVQESRSQWRNREESVKKFVDLLQRALRKQKKRVASRPTRTAIEKRLREKKGRADRKNSRGRVSVDS